MVSLSSTANRSAPQYVTPPEQHKVMHQDRKPTILVTDCGRGSAIAMIRALYRRGWKVIAGDATRQNVALGSRCAAHRFLYPAPKVEPLQFVDSIKDAVQKWKVDLIIPITDEALLPLSKARSGFPPECQLAIPNSESLELTTNKMKTVELATRLGVPVPKTAIVSTAESACQQAESFRWPIVLKPLVSRLYRDGQPIHTLTVSYAENASSLHRQMQKFEGLTDVLLQEYVRGTGYGVELLTHEGRPLAAFQHKRLREVPVTGGASSLREGVALDPLLYDYAVRLLGELRWTGLAMVEFKVGAEGPRLMEINGRVWGSLPLAVFSGVDFPVGLAELYLNGPSENSKTLIGSYRQGVRARNFELDIMWIMAVLIGRKRFPFLPMPGRAAAVSAFFSLFNPRIRYDILSLRDPMPGLAEWLRIAGKLLKKSRDSLP